MEFGILGPLQVRSDGLLGISGAKRIALLARLVLDANRVVPAGRLIDDLWDGRLDASATLQSHVSHLRKIIGPERLHGGGGGYVLDVADDELDAARFEADLATSRARAASGDGDAALEAVERGLSRWRGPALMDVAEQSWALPEAARLDELGQVALELALEVRLAQGSHADVAGMAEAAVAEQPLRETRWAHLMLALYRSGRQADALRAFQRLRTTLAEELGISPSPALVSLEQSILVQSPELDWRPPEETPAVMSPIDGDGQLRAGHEALHRREWDKASTALAAADGVAELAPDDLDSLADAAMYAGHQEISVDARRRAYTGHLRVGEVRRAARSALMLAINHVIRRHLAVAAGWFQKGRRLLEQEPESVEHGYLSLDAALFQVATGDFDAALESARTTFELGQRYGDADLEAVGLVFQGVALVRTGDVTAGLAFFDEAMASTTEGALGPFASGLVYCRMLSACLDLLDYRRAGEWLDAFSRCIEETGARDFPGDCRVHHADLLILRGAWADGAREAELACSECQTFDLNHVGFGFNEIGQIRLRQGAFAESEDAFRRANALGVTPQPGLALLHLARGDTVGAAASINAALCDRALEPLVRARLLPAQVEIALAAGDDGQARQAVDELSQLAERYGTTALRALAASSLGAVALQGGEPSEAVTTLRGARYLWREVDAPYEGARTRELLARALEAVGDRDTAALEFEAARSTFEQLGAAPDAERTATLLGQLEGQRAR